MSESATEAPNYTTIQHEGMKISSNAGESVEEATSNLGWAESTDDPEPEPDAAPVVETTPAAAVPEPAKDKPRSSAKARVEDATAKEAAAKRERDDAKAETARLRAELEALKRQPTPAQTQPSAAQAPVATADPEPDPNDTAKYPDGQFDRKFLAEFSRWHARQEFAAQEATRTASTARQTLQQEANTLAQTFNEKIQAAKADPSFVMPPELGEAWPTTAIEAYPEAYAAFCKERGIDPKRLSPFNDIADVMVRYSNPRGFADHFTAHPDDLQRLSTLPRPRVLAELGKLEARLDAALSTPAPALTARTNATPPIRPVGGAPVATEPDEYTDDEPLWKMQEREQRQLRLARKRAS